MRFTLRIPEELDVKLKNIAKQKGFSRNDVILAACWELVSECNDVSAIPKSKKDSRRRLHNER